MGFVQVKSGFSNAGVDFVDCTLDSPTTAGSVLIFLTGNSGSRPIISIAETGGGNAATQAPNAAGVETSIGLVSDGHYNLSAPGGVSTWRATSLGAENLGKYLWVIEYTGLTSPALDISNHVDEATGTGTDLSGPSTAVTAAGTGIAFGCVTTQGFIADNPKVGNAFTGGSSLINIDGNAACYLDSPSGTIQPVWSDGTASRAYCSSLVVIKGSGAAGPVYTGPYRRQTAFGLFL